MLKNHYRPLVLLGLVVIAQVFYGLSAASVAFLVGLAYFQNAAYSLQSRSRLRDSNLYHALSAVAASFIFFTTLKFLVAKSLPFAYLTVYVLGTVFGTLHGNSISIWIEKKLHATTQESSKNKNQIAKFWPSMLFLLLLLGTEVGLLPKEPKLLMSLAVLAFLDNFSFSIVTVTRNADNHWIHLGAMLFQSAVKFLGLKILIGEQMNWILFVPNLTGGIIGSISGAELAKILKNKVGASNDAHVKEGKAVRYPLGPVFVSFALAACQLLAFGMLHFREASILFGVVIGQSVAFALVSRARQRNNQTYLVYTSFLSNGVWYAVMHLLAVDNVPNYLFVPNTAGSAAGGLMGQDLAMRCERAIGAVMDEVSPQPVLKKI